MPKLEHGNGSQKRVRDDGAVTWVLPVTGHGKPLGELRAVLTADLALRVEWHPLGNIPLTDLQIWEMPA